MYSYKAMKKLQMLCPDKFYDQQFWCSLQTGTVVAKTFVSQITNSYDFLSFCLHSLLF